MAQLDTILNFSAGGFCGAAVALIVTEQKPFVVFLCLLGFIATWLVLLWRGDVRKIG